MNIIRWCNENNGFLTAILSLIGLVLSVIAIVVSIRTARLCEKRILTPSFGRWDLPPKAIHMSSVYYLKDGKIAKASETLFEDRLYY